jgi:hypothetical protein
MAGLVDDAPGRTRTCRSCGAQETIGPGLRERVVRFLTSVGVDEAAATDIYESRVDLAHARTDLAEEDMRRFRRHADVVARSVRIGVARRLAISLPQLPEGLPFDIPSAVLVLEAIADEPPPDA